MQAKARSRGPLDAGVEAERFGDVEHADDRQHRQQQRHQATQIMGVARKPLVGDAQVDGNSSIKWVRSRASVEIGFSRVSNDAREVTRQVSLTF